MTRKRFVSIERLRMVCAKALLEGYGEVVPYTTWTGAPELGSDGQPRMKQAVQADLSMGCEQPYWFETVARYSCRHVGPVSDPSGKAGILAFLGHAPCRKCKICMVNRSRFWAGRAISEFKGSARTIMGTFTMSPEKHQEFDWRLEVGEPGVRPATDIFSLSEDERFRRRASIFGEEITKWLKQLRKGDSKHVKPQFRYLMIAEAHDSESTSDVMKGRPHFHILLHEKEAGCLIHGDVQEAMAIGSSDEWVRRNVQTRKGWRQYLYAHNDAWIKQQWKHGHTAFQLAPDLNSAIYVCKYLSKSMRVRVRPSNGYGGSRGEQGPRGGGAPHLERSDAAPVGEQSYDPTKQ